MADTTRRELVAQLRRIIVGQCHAAGIGSLRVEPHGDKMGSIHIRSSSYKNTNFTREELAILKSLGISTGANIALIPYQNLQKVVERASGDKPREPVVGTPLGRLMVAATNAADWLCDCEPGTDQYDRGVELRKAVTAVADSRK